MPDLLLELFSEEIPARMQANAAQDLQKLVTNALVDRGLTYEGAAAYVTPRRLTLNIVGLPARQSDQHEDIRGPRVGSPEQALAGFLKKAGLSSIDQAKIESDGKKGEIYIAHIHRAGKQTSDVLRDILPGIVRNFPWPRSMRWGDTIAYPESLRWVRPLHSIVCTFGPETEEPEIVDFEVGGITASNITYGHRFMAPAAIKVRRFGDYVAALEKAKVVLDPARRREIILTDAQTLAFAHGYELVEDEGLLNEVAGLVEWPVVLMGSFDAAFLDIPGEVVRATIRANQKCFVLRNPKTNKLAPAFILTANIEATDHGKAIAAGNSRVVRARLSDALYFWQTDQKPLPDYNPKRSLLDQRMDKSRQLNIVFHEKLGTQGERVDRIIALAQYIASLVGANPADAKRAAELCKADLITEVVGEFPEVQGLMGRRYAELQGEKPEVALAIEEHYKPQGPSDYVPKNPISIALALADKLDTLVGFWVIDEKPTGSKDPFALRRAALGVIRLVLENGLKINLSSPVRYALLKLLVSKIDYFYNAFDREYLPKERLIEAISFFGYLQEKSPFEYNYLNYDGFLKRFNPLLIKMMDEHWDVYESSIEVFAVGNNLLDWTVTEKLYDTVVPFGKRLNDDEVSRRYPELMELVTKTFESRANELTNLRIHPDKIPAESSFFEKYACAISSDLLTFFNERLKVYLREKGMRHDVLDAVISLEANDLLEIQNRAQALQVFLETDSGKNLLAAYKRAANILRAEEKKFPTEAASYALPGEVKYLHEPSEKALGAELHTSAYETSAAMRKNDFTAALNALAKLAQPAEAFFTDVMVNADDAALRLNRLRLLSNFRAQMHAAADFSKIAG